MDCLTIMNMMNDQYHEKHGKQIPIFYKSN